MKDQQFCPRSYSISGINITTRSDVLGIASAIDARLRYFRNDTIERSDIEVTIRRISDDRHHWIDRPDGVSRTVYDPPAGEIIYFDGLDVLYLEDGNGIRVVSDARYGTIRVSVVSDDLGSCWMASHPLFTAPLIDQFKRRGRYSLHAACLGLDDRGLLLAGSSGSGKSTLTVALLRAGFDFLADDTVFLDTDIDGVSIHAFPDEIDITTDTIRFFPELTFLNEHERSPGWPKHQVRPEAVYGINPARRCRPHLIVFPRITGLERSVLTPVHDHTALLELAPNILLTDSASSQRHFDALAALVRQSSCYRLDTGTDLDAATMLLRDLIMSTPPR